MKINKAQVAMSTVAILVLILSMFMYLSFFQNISDSLSTQSDDLACRALVQANSGVKGEISQFFELMNNRCFVDEITTDTGPKEEVFNVVGDEMTRCWYRYGEGQHDFLSNFNTEGSWCFVCGKISFEGEQKEDYSLNEYVEWSQENKLSEKQDEEERTYYDYMNFKYSEVSNEELMEIQEGIKEIQQIENMESLAYILTDQYKYLQDLRLKSIDTSEDLFVVYRFDRLDKDFSEKVGDATIYGIGGVATGILVGMTAETIIWGGVSAITCTGAALTSWTGVGALVLGSICGTTVSKTVVSAGNAATKATLTATKVTRITETIKKISNGIKMSKKTRNLDNIDPSLIKTGSIDEFFLVGDEIKTINPELAKRYYKIGNDMRNLQITHIDELSGALRGLSRQDLVVFTRNIDELHGGAKQMMRQKGYPQSDIDELDELHRLTQIEGVDKATKAQRLKDYTKYAFYAGAGATGAATGYNINFDENQYVDIMTREQYYRHCGTEPIYREN